MSMKLHFEKFSRNNILLSIVMVLFGAALMICALSRRGAPAFEGMFPPDEDEAKG